MNTSLHQRSGGVYARSLHNLRLSVVLASANSAVLPIAAPRKGAQIELTGVRRILHRYSYDEVTFARHAGESSSFAPTVAGGGGGGWGP